MAKKAETGKKKTSKGSKVRPSMADVKDANNAADNIQFPADAPGIDVGEVVPQGAIEIFPDDSKREEVNFVPNPTDSREESAPQSGDVNDETISENKTSPVEEPVSEPVVEEVVAEQAPIEEPVGESVTEESNEQPSVEEYVTNPVPTTPIDEVIPEQAPIEEPQAGPSEGPVIETTPLTQEQLEEKVIESWWTAKNKPADINHFELASSPGIDMNKFSALEAKVGKFKFTRTYIGAHWQITVE